MTGHFVRRGAVTEISNIAMETIGGTIYPEQLSKEVLERLNPLERATLNKEDIKNEAEKRLEDSIKKEEKKLLPDIFRWIALHTIFALCAFFYCSNIWLSLMESSNGLT